MRGLNLRNIVWHGFLSNHEIKLHHITFLFLLLEKIAIAVKDVPSHQPRPMFSPEKASIGIIKLNNNCVSLKLFILF